MRLLLIFILLAIFTFPTSAQEITGRAYYASIYKMDYKVDSISQKKPWEKELAILSSQPFLDEYKLEFTQEESLFKKLPKLEKPDSKKGQISVSISLMGDDEIIYKNLKENLSITEKELYGKLFLIKDSLETKDWELSKESKTIGDYICFKATYLRKSDSASSDTNDVPRLRSEANEIIAWFTPQIPIKNGPNNYGGLPGLILEVQVENLRFLCTKIVLNPKETVVITQPTKGEKVSKKEFDIILEKKNKQMVEDFHTPKRRD